MRRYSHLPLPGHHHVPGSGSRPDMPPLAAGKAGPQAFAYGVDLFNRGYFWEAHEVWEAVWLAALPNSARRQGMRALIQMANAGLKREMGRPAAFARLAGEVVVLGRDGDLDEDGLDLKAAVAVFAAFAARLAPDGTGSDGDMPPLALRR
jgi:hypothetical protein